MGEYSHLVTVQWRLLQMMAERRIKKNTDMAHRLRQLGFEISTRQTGLGMNQAPNEKVFRSVRGDSETLRRYAQHPEVRDQPRCFRSQEGRDTHSTE